jgi:hypothetical protein
MGSNTLKSFETANLLRSVPKTSSGSVHTAGIPEIYGYNVVYDQDHDILNQGSIEHIKKYFDNKQREAEEKTIMSHDVTNASSANQSALDSTNALMVQQHISPPINHPNDYSVNNTAFIIKFTIFILFMWILWDFINTK